MSESISIVGPINTGLTTGGAGTSTATGVSSIEVVGLIYAVYIKYNGAPPAATTDVTIRTKGTSPKVPLTNLITVGNAATDGLFMPRAQTHTIAGAANDVTGLCPVHDFIEVVMAQANDNDSADVWLYVVK